ncbi:MAG: type IV pilus assembly protein [Geobacteraceae bacterium]|nr:MAG: type IV pilus assembly protein [Geobacteraceae bacterium]
MRLHPFRIICNSIVLMFFLVVFTGCAQSKANLKEGISAGEVTSAAIQNIKVSGDASQIEIYADKPLTYTFYKTTEPPKTIIDLAQTEPGLVKSPIEINTGNINQIEVTKHSFGGGFLSRIEISLAKDGEFSVAADPVDKGKLLVTFEKPQTEMVQVKADVQKEEQKDQPKAEEAKSIPAVEVAEKQEKAEEKQPQPEQTSEERIATLPVPAVAAEVKSEEKLQAAAEAKAEEKETQAKAEEAKPAPVVVTAVNVVKDGVEINVTGGVERFKAFKMTKPDRLVVDMFEAKSSVKAKSVAVNSFGVGIARLGLTPDKVRIVFDATDALPPYQVVKSENGLKIIFTEVPAAVTGNGGKETVSESVKPKAETKKAARPNTPAVEAIDFKLMDGYSRIAIKVGDGCDVGKPTKVAQGLSLTINNCRIPRKLQRMLDTSSFASAVREVTPYQVRVKGGYSARILAKLRSDAPFNLKQEGDTIHWDIKNPDISETPALISEVVKTSPVDVAAVAQEERSTGNGEIPRSQRIIEKPGDKKVYTGRKVSLEFSDADIRKIFQLIAEVSNLNFLIADDVSGTISIKLVNVPWDQALDVILETKGLEMKREGNIVQIKPAGKFKTMEQDEIEAKKARERAMDLHTEIFDINYSTVSDVVTQLNSLKTAREGVSVTQDARTNRVIVTDIAPAIEKMRSLIKSLDTPEKQVMIEARIVEATSTFTRDLGVQWGVHYKDGSASFLGINQLDTGFGGIVSTPVPAAGTSGPGAGVGVSFGKLTSNIQLDLRLSAAAVNGQVKIISTPKVVTLNNKAAKISQGQSIPYQTTSAEGTKTEFVEAALTLEVTPHITADGNIGMKIKASNNSAGTGTPPPINKKEATTELQVKNGETTVIGGIYVDSDTDEDRGVPFLQDIPLLGWLFKSNTKTKTKTELLIFITPRIVG